MLRIIGRALLVSSVMLIHKIFEGDLRPTLDGVICVAGTDDSYRIDTRSNFGRTVTMLAPVTAAGTFWHTSDDATVPLMEGNSFSTPHVSGAAAAFVSWEGLYNAWITRPGIEEPFLMVYWRMINNALFNVVDGVRSGDQNLFATTGWGSNRRTGDEPYVGGGPDFATQKVDNPA